EKRLRLEVILENVRTPPGSGESLRTGRALEALERADTPEARQVLQALADGAAGARLTEAARTALQRLRRKASGPPGSNKALGDPPMVRHLLLTAPLLGLPASATAQPAATPVADDALPPGAVARLGSTRFRHADGVSFLAFLPDSKTLVSAGRL